MTVALIKSGYNYTSKSKSWNVLETVLSHLKVSETNEWFYLDENEAQERKHSCNISRVKIILN